MRSFTDMFVVGRTTGRLFAADIDVVLIATKGGIETTPPNAANRFAMLRTDSGTSRVKRDSPPCR